VNLINNGFYYNPSVNDYRVIQISGAAAKLEDFDSFETDKNVIGNGLFAPFRRNYLHMKSRYGRAGFITQDNKVLFTGSPLTGIVNGIEYAPLNYTTDPFYKYDRVEIGKNFAILRKQSNIGTRADFIGYLTPGVCLTASEINYSGVQTVHALEEAACISRLNFLTNNVELLCKGYPFSTTGLTLVDGGIVQNFNYTIDPDTISCNGYHCTYQRYKLSAGRTLIEKEWIRTGEYKRSKDYLGNPLPIPSERITTFLPFPKDDFSDGVVIAGYNFDCFMEAVSQDPTTNNGYTKLSCYGTWDPEDTNKGLNFTDHEFGVLSTRPEKGNEYYDCDYNKCFAVMPTIEYCESNTLGNCCINDPITGCRCLENVTSAVCASADNSTFYTAADQYNCDACEIDCADGDPISLSCLTEEGGDPKGACCVTTQCPQTGTTRYSCACRRIGSCNVYNGVFYENKTVDDPSVDCGPDEGELGKCRFAFSGGFLCLANMTVKDCHMCTKVEDGVCTEFSSGGNPYYFGNTWIPLGSDPEDCGC
jgi:hypothetical protein